MFTKLKAFLTTKFYFTQGQVITQGMLYQLEKKNESLRRSNGQLRAHNKSLEDRIKDLANDNLILEERLKRKLNEKDSIGE